MEFGLRAGDFIDKNDLSYSLKPGLHACFHQAESFRIPATIPRLETKARITELSLEPKSHTSLPLHSRRQCRRTVDPCISVSCDCCPSCLNATWQNVEVRPSLSVRQPIWIPNPKRLKTLQDDHPGEPIDLFAKAIDLRTS